MADRTVRLQYITYHDDDGIPYNATQGEEVDTSTFGEGEEERLDSLGAFDDSPPVEEDTIQTLGADTIDRESGLEHAGEPEEPEGEDAEIPEAFGDDRAPVEKAADLEEDGDREAQPTSRSGRTRKQPADERSRTAKPANEANAE